MIRNLIAEKIGHKFRSSNKTRQASGLSPCMGMIASSVPNSAKVVVDNARHIELSVQRFRPKNLILATIFATRRELEHLRKSFPNVNIYVMVHSNSPFLAVQHEAMQRINEAKESGAILAVNDERLARAIPDAVWLPNIYSGNFAHPRAIQSKEEIRVICSGSLRPMKNHLTQALAAIKYADESGKRLRFFVNRRSEGGAPVLSNLKNLFLGIPHSLEFLEWKEHGQFVESLRHFDIGMQVSMSESFNIVAADYACAGLPMVVSHEVRWASDSIKADCHDVDDIASKMRDCDKYTHESQAGLASFSNGAIDIWSKI